MRDTERVPLDALAEIVELKRELVDLKATVLKRIHVLGVSSVRAAIATGYSVPQSRILTTQTIGETLTIVIPSFWNTYDIDVFVSFSVFEDLSSAASTTVNFALYKTNLSGARWGRLIIEVGTVVPDTSPTGAFTGFAEGETTTGNVDMVFASSITAQSNRYAWDDLIMVAYARRVT